MTSSGRRCRWTGAWREDQRFRRDGALVLRVAPASSLCPSPPRTKPRRRPYRRPRSLSTGTASKPSVRGGPGSAQPRRRPLAQAATRARRRSSSRSWRRPRRGGRRASSPSCVRRPRASLAPHRRTRLARTLEDDVGERRGAGVASLTRTWARRTSGRSSSTPAVDDVVGGRGTSSGRGRRVGRSLVGRRQRRG